MSNADRSIWQFPKNVANKVPGWRSDGKGLENKDWADPAQIALDIAGKQDASANLTTLAGIVPGATGQTILADVDGSDTADAVIAAPTVLRSRALDQIFLTDPAHMGTSTANDYRDGLNPDITQELIDADAALSTNGTMVIPKKAATISGTVTKKQGSNWIATGSTINDTWTCAFNGPIIDIVGTGTSIDGSIEGLRLLGNKTTYPASIAIEGEDVFTNRFKHLRIGGFNYGIKMLDAHALVMDNVYTFDCATDGVLLEGTLISDNTDHRLFDCQFTGDNAGLHLKKCTTPKLIGCRPQSSGVANLLMDECYDFQMIGGYCDSGAIHSGGGLYGIKIINSQRGLIQGVNFYTNGDGAPHIRLESSDSGSPTRFIQFANNRFTKGSGQTNVFGATFATPTGTGFFEHITFSGNDFSSVDQGITGSLNVRQGLRVSDDNRFPSTFGMLEAVTETGSTITPARAYPKLYRLPGTAAAHDFTVPSAGNYEGKEYHFTRISGTGGAITLKSEAGTTIATLAASAGAWAHIRCTTQSSTATSVVWSKFAGS